MNEWSGIAKVGFDLKICNSLKNLLKISVELIDMNQFHEIFFLKS